MKTSIMNFPIYPQAIIVELLVRGFCWAFILFFVDALCTRGLLIVATGIMTMESFLVRRSPLER